MNLTERTTVHTIVYKSEYKFITSIYLKLTCRLLVLFSQLRVGKICSDMLNVRYSS